MAEEQAAEFAEILRRARRAAGLSQEELAERAGLSARAISALERGVNRAPRPDTLDMLADALALSPDERRRWQQIRRQQASRPGEHPAVAGARATPPNNLPSQPTRFFGRDAEIDRLTATLRDPAIRLVTLTGPGGTGKTRLALQVAVSLLDGFPDGMFFVDLAPISDPALVLPVIGASVGVRPLGGQPVGAALAEWANARQMLLLLDNFEQVLAAATEVGDLIGRCPGVQVLATSRAPLRLRAEHEFPVTPLPVIDTLALAEAAESDAVRLFIDRARAVRPDFSEDAALIVRICQRLDGLPLAIELAAASVRLFPPVAILARLEQRLPLLVAGHRDAPARQRTLHDTIAWSYDLLPPPEQALFRRLSIFKGGWTLDAAEAVAGGDVLQETETLIEHSLIQSHSWLDGSPRFTMLETIREFGLEQLTALGEIDGSLHRLATFLLRLNAESVEQLRSPTFRRWLERGDAEIENVRLVLDWSTTHDPELALRLAREAGWYLLTRGGFIEARQWLERAFFNAVEIPDDLRAGTLLDMGMFATTYLDFESASKDVGNAYALYQHLGDAAGIAECKHAFGRIAMWSGDDVRAIPFFEDAIARFRQLDSSTLAVACANLSSLLFDLGDLDRVADVLAEGLAQAERRGDVWSLVLIVGGISDLERRRGAFDRARQAMRRGFLLHRELQDPRYIAQDLVGYACQAIEDGEAAFAAQLLGAASSLRERIGLSLDPVDEPKYVRLIPIGHEQIGIDRWTEAWESGRTFSQSEAIDLALEGLTR